MMQWREHSLPTSVARMDATYGLSLLLVLLSALRRFSPGISVLPAPQIPTYHKFNLYWKVSPNL